MDILLVMCVGVLIGNRFFRRSIKDSTQNFR